MRWELTLNVADLVILPLPLRPALFRLSYATEFKGSLVHLRPFTLAWRADTGCSGYLEPDQALMILEIIMTKGFLQLFILLQRSISECVHVVSESIPLGWMFVRFCEVPDEPKFDGH